MGESMRCHSCVIIGTGPAALTAATFLSQKGIQPVLMEKRQAPGWKLLVAGSSGLNVTSGEEESALSSYYRARTEEISSCLKRFPRSRWLSLLQELGEEPFLGSSRRYFVRSKTAASLLKSWTDSLEKAGAQFFYSEELESLEPGDPLTLHFRSGSRVQAKTALLALGGGSWETEPPRWPELLRRLGLAVSALEPSNAGYSLEANPEFFAEAEGAPVKGLTLTTKMGKRQGELMITRYGLEGTPIYAVGCPGPAILDLKPDLSEERLSQRIAQARGELLQRVERGAKLSRGAILLFRQFAPIGALHSPSQAAQALKKLPIELLAPRPLSESISAKGGLHWEELDENLQIKRIPGLFAAGEMVDWDAPTGGFLLQACVSMSFVAAEGIAKILETRS